MTKDPLGAVLNRLADVVRSGNLLEFGQLIEALEEGCIDNHVRFAAAGEFLGPHGIAEHGLEAAAKLAAERDDQAAVAAAGRILGPINEHMAHLRQ